MPRLSPQLRDRKVPAVPGSCQTGLSTPEGNIRLRSWKEAFYHFEGIYGNSVAPLIMGISRFEHAPSKGTDDAKPQRQLQQRCLMRGAPEEAAAQGNVRRDEHDADPQQHLAGSTGPAQEDAAQLQSCPWPPERHR